MTPRMGIRAGKGEVREQVVVDARVSLVDPGMCVWLSTVTKLWRTTAKYLSSQNFNRGALGPCPSPVEPSLLVAAV